MATSTAVWSTSKEGLDEALSDRTEFPLLRISSTARKLRDGVTRPQLALIQGPDPFRHRLLTMGHRYWMRN